MKRVRDMLRVVLVDDSIQYGIQYNIRYGIRYDPPELYGPQLIEVKEKVALLKMLDDHGKIKGVGIRHNENVFYIDLGEVDNVS